MKKAKEYIACTEEIVMADLAAAVGYKDLSYFIKTYRNYYGETPGQTRKGSQ